MIFVLIYANEETGKPLNQAADHRRFQTTAHARKVSLILGKDRLMAIRRQAVLAGESPDAGHSPTALFRIRHLPVTQDDGGQDSWTVFPP